MTKNIIYPILLEKIDSWGNVKMTKRERFVLWLNRFYHKQNKITICILYTLIMIILGVIIYGATHQNSSSNVTVKYTVPYYTITFDPNGGELSTMGGGGIFQASKTW